MGRNKSVLSTILYQLDDSFSALATYYERKLKDQEAIIFHQNHIGSLLRILDEASLEENAPSVIKRLKAMDTPKTSWSSIIPRLQKTIENLEKQHPAHNAQNNKPPLNHQGTLTGI